MFREKVLVEDAIVAVFCVAQAQSLGTLSGKVSEAVKEDFTLDPQQQYEAHEKAVMMMLHYTKEKLQRDARNLTDNDLPLTDQLQAEEPSQPMPGQSMVQDLTMDEDEDDNGLQQSWSSSQWNRTQQPSASSNSSLRPMNNGRTVTTQPTKGPQPVPPFNSHSVLQPTSRLPQPFVTPPTPPTPPHVSPMDIDIDTAAVSKNSRNNLPSASASAARSKRPTATGFWQSASQTLQLMGDDVDESY